MVQKVGAINHKARIPFLEKMPLINLGNVAPFMFVGGRGVKSRKKIRYFNKLFPRRQDYQRFNLCVKSLMSDASVCAIYGELSGNLLTRDPRQESLGSFLLIV